jgi:hypothetical protein
MEITYVFLLAPTLVLWIALMILKLFLYLNDPLRKCASPGAQSRWVKYLRSMVSRRPTSIKKSTPQNIPLAYHDLPSRPINKQRLLEVIKADFDHGVAPQ